MIYEFRLNASVVAAFPGCAAIGAIAEEVGMYSATPAFIRKHGGPLARSLLEQVPDDYFKEAADLGLQPNADIRIHRLYPGDFPAYPGWHCDGEFRESYFAQPDLNKIPVSRHLIATISTDEGGVSTPEFLVDPIDCPIDTSMWTPDMRSTSDQHNLWAQVHQRISSEPRQTLGTQDGQLWMFDARSLHRVRPARIRGWRFFFRMSMWHRNNLGEGRISKQEQVYKLVEGSGW